MTAERFAVESGLNAGTLRHWAWRLGRDVGVDQGDADVAEGPPPVIEVRTAQSDDRFELELVDGRRLRVPSGFDRADLERLLEALGGQG